MEEFLSLTEIITVQASASYNDDASFNEDAESAMKNTVVMGG